MLFLSWCRSIEFAGWRSLLMFFMQKNGLNIFEINEYTNFLLPKLQRIEHYRAAHIWYHLFIYQNTEAVRGKKAGRESITKRATPLIWVFSFPELFLDNQLQSFRSFLFFFSEESLNLFCLPPIQVGMSNWLWHCQF